jgi:hypothetical protein
MGAPASFGHRESSATDSVRHHPDVRADGKCYRRGCPAREHNIARLEGFAGSVREAGSLDQ